MGKIGKNFIQIATDISVISVHFGDEKSTTSIFKKYTKTIDDKIDRNISKIPKNTKKIDTNLKKD